MPFFGPGGLGGTGSAEQLDPKLLDALMQQFPQLAQMQGQPQAPSALAGYQYPGPVFFPGQGTGGFGNLSPFEGAKGFGSESITAGLALGNYGKSSSQQGQPAGSTAQPFSLGALSLPSLALPQQVAAAQGGGGAEMMGGAPAPAESGGMSLGLGDVAEGAQQAINTFGGPDLGTQTTTPGFAEQRAGERTDYTNLTGSPSGVPQPTFGPGPSIPGPSANFWQTLGNAPSASSPGAIGGAMPTQAFEGNVVAPAGAEMMPGQGPTSFAPGGTSAQDILGAGSGEGGLLSTLGATANTAVTGAAGIGGVAQVVAGVQGLMSGDSKQYSGALLQLAQGGVQSYQALQQLSQQFPQISEAMIGQTLPSIGEGLMKLTQGVGGDTATQLVSQIDNFVNGTATAGAGAAGGLAGGLSAGGAGAGAVAAILGIIAQQTGSKELGMAAQALGAAASAVATTAAVTGAVTAGLTGGVVGATTAAGAAFAPIAAFMIVSTVSGLLGGEDPVGDGIGEMMTSADNYQSFVPELMQNVGQQDKSFSTLQQALPYVQTQEELGQLINSYKNYLQTTTGITLEEAQGDPYQLASIPGVGTSTHGMATQGVDFGAQQRALQQQIDALSKILPGQRITSQYGQPGGGLEGEAGRRLWQQFFAPGQTPASYGEGTTMNPSGGPGQVEHMYGGGVTGLPSREQQVMLNPGGWQDQSFYQPTYGTQTAYGVYAGAGNPYTYSTGQDIANAQNAGTFGQGTRWDPATGQYVNYSAGNAPPSPSDYFQQSPYWQQAQQNMFAESPQGQYNQQFMQQIQQYQQQLAALQGGLPQLQQGLQQQVGAGLDPGVLAALQQQSPGFGAPSAGGVDLQALLRQLGLAA